jgi:hypothetical protein
MPVICSDSGGTPQPVPAPDREILETIAELPRDVGWFLLVGGLISELGMPGVPPFWIPGMLILWPRTGTRVAKYLQRRSPSLFNKCLHMVNRYAQDLEKRYPMRQPNQTNIG